MELNFFDDRHLNRRGEMCRRVLEPWGLPETELRANTKFASAWEKEKACATAVPGVTPEHGIAIATYTNNHVFSVAFNGAVPSLGTNTTVYIRSFKLESLRFLQADAAHLRSDGPKCYDVTAAVSPVSVRRRPILQYEFSWGDMLIPPSELFEVIKIRKTRGSDSSPKRAKNQTSRRKTKRAQIERESFGQTVTSKEPHGVQAEMAYLGGSSCDLRV
ncbi:hypothetical protein MATL_G00221600 [Megalops atlanticus]|uniref:NAD(P)(+)--arginine ADP-ribosyltransferase n=1 Tax=Megalops atlanticus TaxID=7932 RepID=A0A9D3PEY2_MEGAT|nr:hypothetical protein MATL_G00221600 [Megalops atlanticus]